jgi:cytochrome b561
MLSTFKKLKAKVNFKRFNSTLPHEVASYAKSLQFFHWFQAVGITMLVASGKEVKFKLLGYKVSTMRGELSEEEKKMKGNLMGMHKSVGLLMLLALFPRVFLRLTTKLPPIPKGAVWEQIAGKLSHASLYGAIVVMPISGTVAGYLSGYGLPFFGMKFEGASKETRDKEFSQTLKKNAFKIHVQVGKILEILLPLHVGAVGFHFLKGENLLTRMNIFAKNLPK